MYIDADEERAPLSFSVPFLGLILVCPHFPSIYFKYQLGRARARERILSDMVASSLSIALALIELVRRHDTHTHSTRNVILSGKLGGTRERNSNMYIFFFYISNPP